MGRSGLRLSIIGLGAWLNVSTTSTEGEAILRRALDRGVTFLDTANVYGLGEAETAWGKWLAHVPRESFVLASKCFFPMGHGPFQRGLSRKHIRASIDASLTRLRTDYLDLYQCHRYDPESPVDEVVRTMNDLISAGKIHHWGTSQWPAEALREAWAFAKRTGREGPISDQPCHNLLDRTIESEVQPACAELDMAILPYSPLAQGVLTGKYLNGPLPMESRASHPDHRGFVKRFLEPEAVALTRSLADLAKRSGFALSTLSLRWLLSRPQVASVIVGASRVAQLDESLLAAEAKIPSDVLAEATRLSTPGATL